MTTTDPTTPQVVAVELVAELRAAGATVATAESLTGGAVCATLVDVPGASDVVRGGVVAYAAEVKTGLLGVAADLVAERGTVDVEVAEQLASQVRVLLGASFGVATTGVAGPGPSEGKPAGTVHVAVASAAGVTTRSLQLGGDRAQVRSATTASALSMLLDRVREEVRDAPR